MDILEIFEELEQEFDDKDTREELDEHSAILKEIKKILEEKEPLYSNKITNLLDDFESNYEHKIITYFEERWQEYYNTLSELDRDDVLLESEELMEEFFENYYNYNNQNKYE